MGLTMKEKQAVTREYAPRYQQAAKKEKQALPDEFTRLTGYHRKYKDTPKVPCALYNPVELQQNVNRANLRLRQRLARTNCIRTQEQLSVTFSK
jgi:hypothetical protein